MERLAFLIEDLLLHRHRGLWRYDVRMVAHLMDVHWRTDYTVELITFKGKRFAERMERRFAKEQLPGEVMYGTPETLWNWVKTPAHLAVLVGREPQERFLGSKGHWVHDPELFDLAEIEYQHGR